MGQSKFNKPTAKTPKKRIKAKTKRIIGLVAGLAAFFIVILVLGLAVSNDWFEGFGPACVVGDVEVSKEEYQFNFYTNYSAYVSYYSDYLSYIGLDTSKPLASQSYSDTMTWKDYFDEETYKNLQDTIGLSETAKEKGIALSEENSEKLASYVSSIKDAAKEQKLSFRVYTKNAFGRKLTEQNVSDAYSRLLLADQYAEVLFNSYEISDDEITAHYNENTNDYDTVTYRMINIAADIPDQTDEEDDEYAQITADALAAAKATADELIAKISNETSFAETALEYAISLKAESDESEEEAAVVDEPTLEDSLYTAAGTEKVSDSDGADWLFSADRQAGDMEIIEETEGYSIYLFLSRELDVYKAVNVRHILAPFNEDMEEAADATEDKAALIDAQGLQSEFEANGGTEEAFIELAKAKGTDATAQDGGLLEKVEKGKMVEGFEDWIFDEVRKPGDYDIVKTEYGYHLIYFVSYGDEAWKIAIDNEMRQELYDTDYKAIMLDYNVYVNDNLYYEYTEEEKAS